MCNQPAASQTSQTSKIESYQTHQTHKPTNTSQTGTESVVRRVILSEYYSNQNQTYRFTSGVVFKKFVLDPDLWDHLQILDCLLNKRPANSDGLHVNLFWNKNMFAKRVGESISNKLSNYLDLGGQHHVFLGPPWAILALGPGPHFRIQN